MIADTQAASVRRAAAEEKARARNARFLNGFGFFVLIVTTTIAVVYPFYWMLMASLTPEGYSLANAPLILPDEWSIGAYQSIFTEKPVWQWMGNTLVATLGATLVVLPASLLASYSLNRFRFRGRNAFIFFVLLSQLLPTSALIVPLFLIFRNYALLDTIQGTVIAYTTFMLPMSIWVLWGYMQSIPRL
ncbi:MAG: carbohydrate ABC transporter permease [Chloroflexi bacterium]|nr:carbohydrate ABC transporter permease [Chloroflexota bacterium]